MEHGTPVGSKQEYKYSGSRSNDTITNQHLLVPKSKMKIFIIFAILFVSSAWTVAEQEVKNVDLNEGEGKSPVKRGLSLSALGLGGLGSGLGYSNNYGYGNGYSYYGNSGYPSSHLVTNRPLGTGYASPYSGVSPSLQTVYVNPGQLGGSYSVGVIRPGYSGLGYPTYIPQTYRSIGYGYPYSGVSYGGYDGYGRAGNFGGYGF